MQNKKTKKNRGFTLIELLVVISIIGILSSVILASLTTAREKAIDSKSIQEIYNARLAVQMFENDKEYLPAPSTNYDTAMYCLTDSCVVAGNSTFKFPTGEIAYITEQNKENKNFLMINKAYALFGGLIGQLSRNAEIVVSSRYLSSKYRGPFYRCKQWQIIPDLGAKCVGAEFIVTLNNNSCPSGFDTWGGFLSMDFGIICSVDAITSGSEGY